MAKEPDALWVLPSDFPGAVVPAFNLPAAGVYDVWARGGRGCLTVRVTDLTTVGPLPGEDAWTQVATVAVPQTGGPNSSRLRVGWSGAAPAAMVLGRSPSTAPATPAPGPDDRRLCPAAGWIAAPRDDVLWPAEVRHFRLADECVASCNPAVGDLDGDGLDEFAVPYSLPDGRDGVACFKGDGRLLWVNENLAFFQRYYGQPDRYAGFHLHHRGGHRHLWAAVHDADDDGRPEVVVGIGPLYVLDGRTGAVKHVLDLRGGVHFWGFARFDGPDRPASLVAAVDPLDPATPGFVCAVGAGPCFPERWRVTVPSRRFEDCLKAGDLDGTGRELVAYSLSDVREFWAMDGDGQVRWKVNVPEAIGDDTHVDDFRFITHPRHGRCLVSGTGGTLLDAQGRVVWSLRDRLEHGQTVHLLPDATPQGPALYFADSFDGRALFASLEGEVLAVVEDFTRVVDARRGDFVHRLTTAGDLAHWGPAGGLAVVQGEILYARGGHDVPAGPVPLRLSVIAPDGRRLGRLPLFDEAVPRSWSGPMCVKACRATPRAAETGREDLLVVLHSSSQAVLYGSPGRP